ncbi:hypothetical protein [Dyella sp. 20L07]|uniref:hypothetical protein n=1 Tax=Dyella sp. 20L07 TaxID=3384240 RepID=UPI003D26936E
MHTIIVVGSGILLLGFMLLTGQWTSVGVARGALIFVPIWLALALVNLWIGVSRAGYSVREEMPIFLVVFGVPASLALIAWWYFRK